MTTQTEALKLALEALESSRIFVTSREKIKHPEGTDWYDERISAIKEALSEQAVVEHDLAAAYRTELDKLSQRNYELRMENAQLKAQPKEPEQEPVAWMNDMGTHIDLNVSGRGMPLYTTPPQRKPLTDDEMKKIWYAMQNIMGWYSFEEVARAIEAAHGIKELA